MTGNDDEMALRLLVRLAKRDRALVRQADGRFSVLTATDDGETREDAADPHLVARLVASGLLAVLAHADMELV